jgi:hypothetical protein
MVAETLTTWPPYRLTIPAMARWVSQKNPARLTPNGGVVNERFGDEQACVC